MSVCVSVSVCLCLCVCVLGGSRKCVAVDDPLSSGVGVGVAGQGAGDSGRAGGRSPSHHLKAKGDVVDQKRIIPDSGYPVKYKTPG